jgi:hypothetical protein
LDTVPQFLPEQADACAMGVQPQTLARPPPPHVWGELHEPQFKLPPHPSGMVPQFLPWAAQVVGWQMQTLLPHIRPAPQAPQSSVLPQPSERVPQFFPWAAQVVG